MPFSHAKHSVWVRGSLPISKWRNIFPRQHFRCEEQSTYNRTTMVATCQITWKFFKDILSFFQWTVSRMGKSSWTNHVRNWKINNRPTYHDNTTFLEYSSLLFTTQVLRTEHIYTLCCSTALLILILECSL